MNELPRIAIVSDVVPCRTQGGELLLYRLLNSYSPDRLAVFHTSKSPYYIADKLLECVDYQTVSTGYLLPSFLRNRWLPFWRAIELKQTSRYADVLCSKLKTFNPDMILTITDNTFWVAAAKVARKLGLPLVIIQHDDVASKSTANSAKLQHKLTRWFMNREVGKVYRQAVMRFCVSPGMAELYLQRFGASAEVLYPNRGEDSPEPRLRLNLELFGKSPVVAFAGALYTQGAINLLKSVATVLDKLGGRLDLYTKATRDSLRYYNLDLPNVKIVGFYPPREMAERISASAHILFLPASFLPNEATDVATLFPSKLADYTAIGLPILIWGPNYSSAVRWGMANRDCAYVCTINDPTQISSMIMELASDPEQAAKLASNAIAAGNRDFSLEATRTSFLSKLVSAHSSRHTAVEVL